MCNRANRIPPATVMKVQRMPPALSPDFAARTENNMVKLLVTRMKVISITLTMLGENLNGSGQSGLAFFTYPYAKRTAPNVIASAMMNSHMTSFLDGIAKGDCSKTGDAWLVIVASLTAPPVAYR